MVIITLEWLYNSITIYGKRPRYNSNVLNNFNTVIGEKMIRLVAVARASL